MTGGPLPAAVANAAKTGFVSAIWRLRSVLVSAMGADGWTPAIRMATTISAARTGPIPRSKTRRARSFAAIARRKRKPRALALLGPWALILPVSPETTSTRPSPRFAISSRQRRRIYLALAYRRRRDSMPTIAALAEALRLNPHSVFAGRAQSDGDRRPRSAPSEFALDRIGSKWRPIESQ